MKKKLLLFIVILMVMMQFQTVLAWAQGAETVQTVKVGFFAFDGYHVIDENGQKSGYGYEFLNLLSRYCNLRFEYTGYDKSWQETLEMRERGEIDLVTSAKRTPEREKKFAFSKPIGSSYTIITVHKDNNRIIPGDYKTYNGITMGLLRGNSQNENLKEFAGEKGFSYKPVYYNSVAQLKDALNRGEIDAITTSSLRETEEERVIEKFDANLFYAIVRKDDTELLDAINYGIEQMDLTEGDWKNQLSYKYYNTEGNNVLQFTDREKKLIQFYNSDQNRLKVACNVDRDPYSYEENGEIKGIIPDVFSYLMDMAGIPFEYIIPESRAQYDQWIDSGSADIFIDFGWDGSNKVAETGGVVTADYLEMNIAK
ncbi:MAG: transporter substrate-binding domain-containing protein [Anaerovoracaceae bacterium]